MYTFIIIYTYTLFCRLLSLLLQYNCIKLHRKSMAFSTFNSVYDTQTPLKSSHKKLDTKRLISPCSSGEWWPGHVLSLNLVNWRVSRL